MTNTTFPGCAGLLGIVGLWAFSYHGSCSNCIIYIYFDLLSVLLATLFLSYHHFLKSSFDQIPGCKLSTFEEIQRIKTEIHFID